MSKIISHPYELRMIRKINTGNRQRKVQFIQRMYGEKNQLEVVVRTVIKSLLMIVLQKSVPLELRMFPETSHQLLIDLLDENLISFPHIFEMIAESIRKHYKLLYRIIII